LVGLVSSLACGFQVYQFGMMGVWGAPASPLHPIALLGALFLLVGGGTLTVTGSRGNTVMCLVATVPVWVFYGPAAFVTCRDFFRDGEFVGVLPLLPLLLLTLCTTLAIWFVGEPQDPAPPHEMG
jgi:hypothetical protein